MIPDPSFWETPRGIWLIITIAIATGLIFGLLGYKIASTPQRIDVYIVQGQAK